MATNDVYELIDYQSAYGIPIENVYFYRRNAASFVDTTQPTVAGSLLNSWYSKIFPTIYPCQGTDVIHTKLTMRNLFDDSDAANLLISQTGTANVGAVEDLPPYNAYAVKFGTPGLLVKDGYKRLAGVIESAQVDGGLTNPTIVLRLTTFANKVLEGIRFSADLPINQVAVLTVVKRVRSGVPGDYEYRLPENQGESVWADVGTAVIKFLLTSQVSRKIVGF